MLTLFLCNLILCAIVSLFKFLTVLSSGQPSHKERCFLASIITLLPRQNMRPSIGLTRLCYVQGMHALPIYIASKGLATVFCHFIEAPLEPSRQLAFHYPQSMFQCKTSWAKSNMQWSMEACSEETVWSTALEFTYRDSIVEAGARSLIRWMEWRQKVPLDICSLGIGSYAPKVLLRSWDVSFLKHRIASKYGLQSKLLSCKRVTAT